LRQESALLPVGLVANSGRGSGRSWVGTRNETRSSGGAVLVSVVFLQLEGNSTLTSSISASLEVQRLKNDRSALSEGIRPASLQWEAVRIGQHVKVRQ
jgi:hypothetical protein